MTMPSDPITDPAGSRAVLIGAYNFTHQSYKDRRFPEIKNNIDDLAKLLCDPTVWGLPKTHCQLVHEVKSGAELMKEVYRSIAEATGTLLVYYAGHGFVGSDQKLFLTDIASEENNPASAFNYEILRNAISRAQAKNRIVILDCCRAGNAILTLGDDSELLEIDRTFILAAARGAARAAAKGERHTAFTAELIALLSEGSHGSSEKLNMKQVYDDLQLRLSRKYRPIPVMAHHGVGIDLPLFQNRAYRDPGVSEPPIPPSRVVHHWFDPVTASTATATGLIGGVIAALRGVSLTHGVVAGLVGAFFCYLVICLASLRKARADA